VLEHGAALSRTAWLLTGDRGHAEDLVQTALARAYGKWSRVRRADDPGAYVQRLLVNAFLSWRRRRSSTETVVDVLPEGGVDDLQSAHADRDEMRTALAGLSPRVRTAVVLRYFEDLDQAETARRMGCSVKTVDDHVTRGLAALRASLAERSPDDLTTTVPRRRP
jgi:RNA polymerase sigma-70 factor (sigma-E family)